MKCRLCPRGCGVDREMGERGFCNMGARAVVARAAPHYDEEPCLSGKNGSGAVFFSGCTLGCVYCQNEKISRFGFGQELSDEQLRALFARLIGSGVNNLNLVTGTHFIPAILRALPTGKLPVIWNSGGYETLESLKLLEGAVNIYLPDLKYVDEEGARAYSGAQDYPAVAKAALLEMARQAGEAEFNGEGIMTRGLIVRHLVLPGRAEQSIDALKWIAANLPRTTYVSLMAQYVPSGRAKDMPPLNRRVSRREYERVLEALFSLGLDLGWAQERGSASARYVPDFDLTGLEG